MLLVCQAELLFATGLFFLALYGRQKLRAVGRLVAPPPKTWPKVSIIVAARNEAPGIETATRSLLEVDYPSLEWIVVDDRSEDDTPRLLAKVAADHPALRVIRVDTLPPGWLGKNHALAAGAKAASGEYLLFTDADIVYRDRQVLRKVIAQLLADGTDHGTMFPRLHSRSWLCESFMAFFGMQFMVYFKPWEVPNPRSKAYVGVGAFNLVRREALQKAGGLEAISLRPDDDVKLGKLLKRAGFRTELFTGVEALECQWHFSLSSCLRGLEKSVLPGFDYNLWLAAFAFSMNLAFHALPFFLVFFAGPAELPWIASACLLQMITVTWVAHNARLSRWYGLLTPLSAVLCLWVVLRNTGVVLWRGGLEWRGTFYSLKELKRNVV